MAPGGNNAIPTDLGERVKTARAAGMSDDDLVEAMASHPALGERVGKARQAGISSADIVAAMSTPDASQPLPAAPKPVSIPLHNSAGTITPAPDKPLSVGEKVATAPLKFMAGSAEQFGRGTTRMAHPASGEDFAGGVSDVVRGGMGLAAPFTAPAMLANKLPTAVGLVTGGAVGAGTELGLKAAGVPEGYAELGGTVAGVGAGGAAAHGVTKLGKIDPHVASLRAWNFHKDPRILDQISSGDIKLDAGLADLKVPFSQVRDVKPGYSNEIVLRALPEAKAANRAAWDEWMGRAEGQYRDGEPIVRATMTALKDNIHDDRAQTIVQEAARQFARPLTPRELEAIIIQKNGELKSFYSGSKEVQAAAERAGADTLKTRALLEAQVKTARELLNKMLDPDGNGAAPRELQSRFGALSAIEEAANARRTDIIAEHPVNPLERGANFHLDPRAIIKAKQGSSEWLIENAIKAAGDAPPLPRPTGPYPINPRQIGAGSIRVGPITPDGSYVRGAQGMQQPPNPQRALPPATTRFAAMPGSTEQFPTTSASSYMAGRGPTTTPGSPAIPPDSSLVRGAPGQRQVPSADPSVLPPSATQRIIDLNVQGPPKGRPAGPEFWEAQPPTRPEIQARYEQLFRRAENLSPQRPVRAPETGIPEGVARGVDARQNIARQVLKGRTWDQATPSERLVIDSLIAEGYGSAPPRPPASTGDSIAKRIGQDVWRALGGPGGKQ